MFPESRTNMFISAKKNAEAIRNNTARRSFLESAI